MEQIQIIGNLGQDAEIKAGNGKEIVFFRVATNFSYKNEKGEKVTKSNWWSVFSRQKEIAQFLKKGSQVFIQGRPGFSVFTNQNGEKSVSLDLNATLIQFIGLKKEQNQ